MTWDEARELAEMAIADREGTGLQLVDRVANAILAAADCRPKISGEIAVRVDSRLPAGDWRLEPTRDYEGYPRFPLRGRR